MTAAPNGASIFPLLLVTTPQQAEYFVDNINQLIELIATQCAAASQGQLALPSITDTSDTTKKVGFTLSGATTATQTTLIFSQTADRSITFPNLTGTLALNSGPAPVAVGSSATASAANGTYLLNTVGGSTLTLPAATGTGSRYRVIVTATTTSAAHKILAASSSDFINGIAWGFTGSTAKVFASAASTNHSIQMPFAGSQPSGGFIGDWFEFTDVATNLWQCSGYYQAGTTPTTPYASATS